MLHTKNVSRTNHASWSSSRSTCTHRVTAPRRVLSKGDNGVSLASTTSTPEAVEVKTLSLEVKRLKQENDMLQKELQRYRSQSKQQPGNQGMGLDLLSMEQAHQASGPMAVVEEAVAVPPAVSDDSIWWPTPGERFWERAPRRGAAAAAGSSASASASSTSSGRQQERDPRPLHVVHIAAEMAPIAKVGGLGDVVTGLARACIERGHTVAVMLPFYESLPQDQIEGLTHDRDIDVPKGYRWDGEMRIGPLRTSVFRGTVSGVPVYLVRPADWEQVRLFRGARIYCGGYDEKEAYLYFCRASLEFLRAAGHQPHILQLHDWHSAAAAMLYWECYHGQGLHRARVVLTIHNMENTGEVRQDEFYFAGLEGERFATVERALDERTIGHNPERLNLMKGGVVFSNAVTTVSPAYASDIINAGAGGFLRPVFNKPEVSSKFRGILNGIDFAEWDPAVDPLLPANYGPGDMRGKAACKEFVQRGLGLSVDPSKPLVVVVSRLVNQKNPGLMQAAAFRTRDKGGQFVLLGSGGGEGPLKRLSETEFKDHPDVRLLIMYSEALSHQLFAAADVVLVPSNFEPCGLTQLIGLRYGAVPVVRRTGGLGDTIHDMDTWSGLQEERNGFTFDGADAPSLHGALDRALAMYQERQREWRELAARNMQADVSWSHSARDYVGLYNSIAVH